MNKIVRVILYLDHSECDMPISTKYFVFIIFHLYNYIDVVSYDNIIIDSCMTSFGLCKRTCCPTKNRFFYRTIYYALYASRPKLLLV